MAGQRDTTPRLRFDATSTNKRIKTFADALLTELLAGQRSPSAKDLAEYRHGMLTVVAGLLLAASYPGGEVRFSTNTSLYSGSRHQTQKMLKCLIFLIGAGYLDRTANHSFMHGRKRGNKPSTYRFGQRWGEMVKQHPLPDLSAIVRQRNAPVVIVRDENKQDMPLIQHPDRKHWVDVLTRYNERLTDHRITLDGEILSSVTFSLRRIFSNGSYDSGGRFFSDIQNRRVDERLRLAIDGEAVAEVDYRATHAWLLYQYVGLAYPHDPYAIAGFERGVVKRAFQVVLNSQKDGTAEALRWQLKMNGDDAKKLDAAIRAAHAPIAQFFGTAAGLWLMRYESDIVEGVLRYTLGAAIRPIIPIHDAFIVAYTDLAHLREALRHGEAFAALKRTIEPQPSHVKVRWHRPNTVIQALAGRVFGLDSCVSDKAAQSDEVDTLIGEADVDIDDPSDEDDENEAA